jgi:hypothetical protein
MQRKSATVEEESNDVSRGAERLIRAGNPTAVDGGLYAGTQVKLPALLTSPVPLYFGQAG